MMLTEPCDNSTGYLCPVQSPYDGSKVKEMIDFLTNEHCISAGDTYTFLRGFYLKKRRVTEIAPPSQLTLII